MKRSRASGIRCSEAPARPGEDKGERRGAQRLYSRQLASVGPPAPGRTDTNWERKRDLLISGLRAVRRALRPETANEVGQGAPEPSSGPQTIERTVYLDEDGETVLEPIQMRTRRDHRQRPP